VAATKWTTKNQEPAMSIFSRSSNPQPPSVAPSTEALVDAGPPEQPTTAIAPAPGVVPPPAAPLYSTRPETAPRVEADAQTSVAEKVRIAKETQRDVREKVRLGVQRARSSMPARDTPKPQPRRVVPITTRTAARAQTIDPVSVAQTGLLNLAWRWQEAGSPIRAIHTYMELLTRYPHTPAAAAAVVDLVDLSEKLAQEGQFHTALAIYDHLEHLA
jgi:hypothetical protein